MEQTFLKQLVNIAKMITPYVEDRMAEGKSLGQALVDVTPKDVLEERTRPLSLAPETVYVKGPFGIEVRPFGTTPMDSTALSNLPGFVMVDAWVPTDTLKPITESKVDDLIKKKRIKETNKATALKNLYCSELGGIYNLEGRMIQYREGSDKEGCILYAKTLTQVIVFLSDLQYQVKKEDKPR